MSRVTETTSSLGVFALLRGRDWRPLLLAVAILAAWARILVPGPAIAHGAGSAAQLCQAADAGVAPIPASDATAIATEPGCAFCRLPELPAALPGPEPQACVASLPADVLPIQGAAVAPVRPSRVVFARGPPSVASSI